MRLNSKETVGSFGGRILIYNKIITRNFVYFFGAGPLPPTSASGGILQAWLKQINIGRRGGGGGGEG